MNAKLITVAILASITLGAAATEPVDMGLSVLWADCNVGASCAEEPGAIFAWGATAAVPYFDWAYYPLCKGHFNTLTKYNSNPELGETDGKTVLESEDDAASVNCGSPWRTPTDAEWVELIKNCDWTFCTRNDHQGMAARSRLNGAEIFLPLVYPKSGGELQRNHGRYWSATLSDSSCWDAIGVVLYDGGIERPFCGRFLGLGVRPVRDR